jgi:hypothetical protein
VPGDAARAGERLHTYLGPRQVLWLLDSCEQVAAAARCGGQLIAVSPLALADLAQPATPEALALAEVAEPELRVPVLHRTPRLNVHRLKSTISHTRRVGGHGTA